MVTKPKLMRPLQAKATHVIRTCVVISLLLAIPKPTLRPQSETVKAPPIEVIELPDDLSGQDLSLDPQQDANGMWRLVDENQETVGLVARTLPIANDVIGYRGPTESLLLFNPDLNLTSVTLLQSADTEEHVTAVKAEQTFFKQFESWVWGGPAAGTQIDAVSGATLTSLALAEGVLKRIGGERPSLLFNQPITIQEIQDWFPEAVELNNKSGEARNSRGELVGSVIRTGPLSDDLSGYQGPTEMLLKVSPSGIVEAIRIRTSFDNEPYVDYVRTEAGFWAIFEGKTVAELSAFDPQAAGVEGVSGATMTSLIVADTVVAATRELQKTRTSAKTKTTSWVGPIRWTVADILTISTLVFAATLKFAGVYRRRLFRRIWLIWVVIIIGFWAGNLVSMALIAGWSAEGVAWRLAPGLAAITCVAMLGPPLTKGNPYCNHLCPHGAIQQLVRPKPRSLRYKNLTPALSRMMRRLPGLTLCAAYIALVLLPTIDLASWEPFHAYLFRIASWSSLAFAFATLAISAVLPMGYCRFGCPTGRLLDYLKRTATSDRLQVGDAVAVGLLVFALLSPHLQ
ncbi:FMN-binding protein [Rubripirellula sp.]|nr:FMN-binding protein [Rubripirellula sp.]MDA9934513.1 FMN-binding protein [Rubripirellula sp.]MDB4634706.1 FMN-binding protein [Rubripirellula sp.]